MKHFGDICNINGHEVPLVDVITGGSPCQDLSVAGKRAGLDGERSGLFLEMIRVIGEMRNEDRKRNGRSDKFLRPRFVVFENVEGLFSSNDGEDFRIVLEEFAKIADGDSTIPRLPTGQTWSNSGTVVGTRRDCDWSIAWRLHDSQFWGVAQRRRRVSIVVDFGSLSAPEILFKSESVSGNFEPCEQERQTASPVAEGSIGTTNCFTLKVRGGNEIDSNGKKAGKGALVQEELSGTLQVSQDQTLFVKNDFSQYSESDVFAPLKTSGGDIGGGKRNPCETVGALQARDYKGIGNQYVKEGKVIVQKTD